MSAQVGHTPVCGFLPTGWHEPVPWPPLLISVYSSRLVMVADVVSVGHLRHGGDDPDRRPAGGDAGCPTPWRCTPSPSHARTAGGRCSAGACALAPGRRPSTCRLRHRAGPVGRLTPGGPVQEHSRSPLLFPRPDAVLARLLPERLRPDASACPMARSRCHLPMTLLLGSPALRPVLDAFVSAPAGAPCGSSRGKAVCHRCSVHAVKLIYFASAARRSRVRPRRIDPRSPSPPSPSDPGRARHATLRRGRILKRWSERAVPHLGPTRLITDHCQAYMLVAGAPHTGC